jgi:serine/threonine protein kinase
MDEPKNLGRYEIKGVLGKGAMGLVYDGLDPQLNRRVALKTILTRKLDPEAAKLIAVRFEREVRAVARLNHRNIVQVYDFGAEGELAYIVMELIEGKELKDAFDAGQRFDLGSIFRIMSELLDALDFAHEAGVVHRDIKPANVMLDAAGHAKLADFGVARVNEPEGPQAEATRVGTMVGTPSYMSPEQVQGMKVDRRSDIFSAGIVFYEFLTGKKPFEGTQWVLASKIIQEDPVWPSKLVQIPAAIDRIVAKALAKEPDQRYPTARAFIDALNRVAKGQEPEAPGEAPISLGGAAAAPAAAKPTAAQTAAGNEVETEFWNGVKDSEDPEDIELYIEQYPKGMFVEVAKELAAALRDEQK